MQHPPDAVALCVNLALGLERAPFSLAMLPLPIAISLGAMLQAWAGAVLVNRYARQPLTLSESRDVIAFLAAAIASCFVSAGVGNAALWLTGTLKPAELAFSLATWWVGDLIGVLIAAPILLTLLGRPRDAWAPRRPRPATWPPR